MHKQLIILFVLCLVMLGCSSVKDGDQPSAESFTESEASPKETDKAEQVMQALLQEEWISAKYWLGDAGEKVVDFSVRYQPDGKKDLVDPKGETILSAFEDYDLMLNLIMAKKENKWGLYDQAGQSVLGHFYDEISNYEMPDGYKANGLVGVKSRGLWGAIDQSGKIVIQPQYDSIVLNYYEEVEPFIKVEQGGKFGYLTRDGKLLVDTVWDAAFMDVLNVPEDIIFVKRDGKWGGIRVGNDVAFPVDWSLQPSERAKLSFNNWRYDYQWNFYRDQMLNSKTGITTATKIFINDYFSENSMELRLLPVFPRGGTPDWGSLSDFIIANTGSKEWADGHMTKEEFDKYMTKYFLGISYAPKPTTGLIYKDEGVFVPAGGFSFHGSFIYELTELDMEQAKDGRNIWRAHIKGYYFYEMDGSSEDDEYQSGNARIVWGEMKKEENQGLSFWEVRDRLVLNDPGSKLDLKGEWTIEFIVNDPLGEIYFTYLSCENKWLPFS